MSASLPITEARAELGQIVDRVAYRKERVRLSKNGKDLAAVVSMDDLQLLRDLEDRIDLDDVRTSLSEAAKKGTIAWRKLKAELKL